MKKILSFLVVITLLIMMLISQVYAHNVEIEKNSYIEFSLEENKLNVVLDGSAAALYYSQFVQLSDDTYESIEENIQQNKDWSNLVPNYDENNWKYGITEINFDSTKKYILWVKIENTKGEKYYDYTIYSPEQILVTVIKNIPNKSSYVNRESLKDNIGLLLAYPLTIKSSTSLENGTSNGNVTMDNDGVKVTSDDSKIRFASKQYDYAIDMYYTITEDKCSFNISFDNIDSSEPPTENEKKEKIVKLLMNSYIEPYYLPVAFLAVADCLNIDKSLAYTYYAQQVLDKKMNDAIFDENSLKEDATYTSEIIKFTRKIQDNKTNCSLEINTEKLLELKQSMVDSSSSYIVKLETGLTRDDLESDNPNGSNKEEETEKDKKTEENQNKGNTTVDDKSKKENKNEIQNQTQKDNTVLKTPIEPAGRNDFVVIISIIGVVTIAGIMYKKYSSYNDIK